MSAEELQAEALQHGHIVDDMSAAVAVAAATPCPQAWHGGLAAGLLVECRHEARHRGWHRSADGSVQWGGKLTDIEQLTADALRAPMAAARTVNSPCSTCGGGNPLDGDDPACQCGSEWARGA